MPTHVPTLHLVCGKIAAGKSTLTDRLGQQPGTVVVAEDHWLARLYPGEQTSLADYARNAARLRDAMAPHLVALLRLDLSVVLDFPANTVASRAWMRTLFEAAGVAHQLHVPIQINSRLWRRAAFSARSRQRRQRAMVGAEARRSADAEGVGWVGRA